MFEQHTDHGVTAVLEPLHPVEHLPAETAPKAKRRWPLWGGIALLVIGVASVIGVLLLLDHRENARVEQAATDSAAYSEAIANYTAAHAEHEQAIAQVAAYAPKLEATVAKVDERPELFDDGQRTRFSSAVAEYIPFTEAVPFEAPSAVDAATLETAYQAGGESYEAASAQLVADAQALAERTEQLTGRTEAIETTRADVDAALAALAESAVAKAPKPADAFPKAPADTSQRFTAALAEIGTVAEGTFAATPKRMPTAAVYEYVNAVSAATAAHTKVVADEQKAAEAEAQAEAERLAAAEAAEQAQLAAEAQREFEDTSDSEGSGSATPPAYTGGGSKEEWMSAAGIAESDWGYVDYIVTKESGWNPNAVNPSSGASGLVQALPCEKVPGNCLDPVDNLRWGDSYAKQRYGSWAAAYDFWMNNHWW